VVLLHGSGPGASGYSNFKQNIDAIVATGRRAILLDMVGFGYSSKPTDRDYTTDLFAGTIRQALDLIGIERFVLVGNSLGGAVSVRIAIDHPGAVEGLVLMAPGGIEDPAVYYAMPGIKSMIAGFVGGALDKEGLRSLLGMLVHDRSLIDDRLVDERYEILQTQPAEVLSRLVVPSMADELGKIRCPILGFWGREDLFTPMSGFMKFVEASPDCAFTIVSNCGHWVMVEQVEMFNAHLRHFLTSRMETGAL
jgi:4,5:9,10-diseco-3-hydroxy-5,9,17-trioxoandrosta-1(10),2-diene-4-oate hydrolase